MPVVLLVVTELEHGQQLEEWLVSGGHQVFPRGSAAEALRALDEGHVPDIVIADLGGQASDALLLLQQVRQHRLDCANIPAIILTTRHIMSDLEEAWALNAALMTKPVEESRLVSAIERALYRSEGRP